MVTRITNAINAGAAVLDSATALTQQFFYNPVKTVSQTLGVAVQTRIDTLNTIGGARTADQNSELAYLITANARINAFITYTDQISGQGGGGGTGSAGECTLNYLIGSGCEPSTEFPDIDLQTIADGLKSGQLIAQAEQALIRAIANGTGYTGVVNAIGNLNNSIDAFNTVINTKLNAKILQAAVEQFIMGLVFSLLSGCNNKALSAIIKPDVANEMAPLLEHFQKIKDGKFDEGAKSAENTTIDTPPLEAYDY
jgi:hypothetical protein